MNRCNFIPPTAGYAHCSREKGHDGPCAHEYKYGRILCAAIKYDDGEYHPHQPVNIKTGFVVSGYRHCQINISVFTLHGKKPHYEKYAKTEGFLTSTNMFANRKQAAYIAYKSGQISMELWKNLRCGELMSEDLY
jgi:hypothetical protein